MFSEQSLAEKTVLSTKCRIFTDKIAEKEKLRQRVSAVDDWPALV